MRGHLLLATCMHAVASYTCSEAWPSVASYIVMRGHLLLAMRGNLLLATCMMRAHLLLATCSEAWPSVASYM
jgi:hypothetical protein